MPLRGESVGTAYVRVLADGTGLPQSIRDEFDDADGAFDDAGSVGAKRFKQSFDEEMKSHTGRTLDDALSDALARDDFTEKFFDSDNWRKFERNMNARFGGVGQDAADQLRDKFTQRGSLAGIEADIERVVERINRNVDLQIRQESEAAARAKKEMVDFEATFRKTMDESEEVSRRVSQDNVNNLERLRRSLESFHPTLATFSKDFDKARRGIADGGRDVDRNEHLFSRFGQTIDHIGDSVGRAFGKGSRSELINFIGSFTGGAVSLLGLPAKIIGNLGEFASGFQEAMAAGDGFFSALKGGFATMGKDASGAETALSGFFSTGLASIPLLIAALLGLVGVLGLVSSLISGLAAAVIGLAASITLGLVASIAALLPLLVVLTGGIGALILGFKSIPKEEAAKFFGGLQKQVDSLGESVSSGFMQTFNSDLEDTIGHLRILNPLAEAFGEGFGNIADDIAKGLDSPTMRRFLNEFTDFVPGALRRLSSIAGNVGGALLAIFTDSIPLAKEFLGWLDDVTQQFQDFITSRPGKVTDFLQDAADSAKEIGHFLGAAFDVLGELITQGKGSGDTIFQSLADNLQTFADFLDKHPDAVGEFFKNGTQVAQDVGDIAVSLGQIFDALDSPAGRKNLHEVLTLLSDLSKLAGPLAFLTKLSFGSVEGFIQTLAAIGGAGGGNVRRTLDIIKGIAKGIGHLKDVLSGFGSGPGGGRVLSINATGLVAWIPGTIAKIRGFADTVGRIFSSIPGTFSGPLSRLRGAASDTVSQIGQRFSTIPGRLRGLAGQFGNAASQWAASLLSRVSDIPTQIVTMFTGLAGRIINAIGEIHIPIHFDIPDLPGPLKAAVGPLGLLHASGGLFDKATLGIIGERGREAVVPLDRPLDQIDPSVRWMAELIRGGGSGSGATTGSGRTVNVNQNITTVATDPVAAASEFVNHLVAVGY